MVDGRDCSMSEATARQRKGGNPLDRDAARDAKRRRANVDAELPMADQASLSWFLSHGLAAFERSTMGPMLDHARLYGHGSIKCGGCRGQGIRQNGDWCDKCKGTGAFPVELDRRNRSPEELPVNETQGSGGGYVPDDTIMTRYAVVSRRLSNMSPLRREALQAHQGPQGDRCSLEPGHRLIAVYPLVPAGKKLIRLAPEQLDDTDRERAPYAEWPSYERAFRQCEWQKTKPLGQRGALIESAEGQAAELFLSAVDEWMAQRGRDAS